jgi:nicotinate-nucleotide pyrophosphorylase (carboxylating)
MTMHTAERIGASQLKRRITWEEIDPNYLEQLIRLAKVEDLAGAGLAEKPSYLGDVTTALMPTGHDAKAQLNTRESCTLCGLNLVPKVLETYGPNCTFETSLKDGAQLTAGTAIGYLSGPAETLLQAERIILNFVQHLSGIATSTTGYVNALGNSPCALLDTRKTLPGYRILQKYAFACGGGYNHRIGLFDRVMLKDNHLALMGISQNPSRLADAVVAAKDSGHGLVIQVEVDRLDQIESVLAAGADIILLDNFTTVDLREAIECINGRALSEASGGIQLERLAEIAAIGLDFISTGAPIHQSQWIDIGLDWL